MTDRKDLLPLSFYEKSPYTGSDGPISYRIEKAEAAEGEGPTFLATAWKGPYSFADTREEKISHTAPFTEDGMAEIVSWLNKVRSERLV